MAVSHRSILLVSRLERASAVYSSSNRNQYDHSNQLLHPAGPAPSCLSKQAHLHHVFLQLLQELELKQLLVFALCQ